MTSTPFSAGDHMVRPFADLDAHDVAFAGGKGANLGELTQAGFNVPGGIVIGAPAYAAMCDAHALRGRLRDLLERVDVYDTEALEPAAEQARSLVRAARIPDDLERLIRDEVSRVTEGGSLPVAVRSSATGEDTAAASFAGMHESFLHVVGVDAVISAIRDCWASLFGARSLFYRARRGFSPAEMDIAVVVQRQIDADTAGVMFTVDPASGATDRLVIEASTGLGEAVVSGSVTPDRYVVRKRDLEILLREVHDKQVAIVPAPGGGTTRRDVPARAAAERALSDDQIRRVAELGRAVEAHYGAAQDTEWALDSAQELWLLQARPVTTGSRPAGDGEHEPPGADDALVRGLGAAPGSAAGAVRIVKQRAEAGALVPGEILVAEMTAPDWVPLMTKAAGIVTDQGGMTCHAAIVSRELGIPCIVGTGNATGVLQGGQVVTVDAAAGTVRAGSLVPAATATASRPVRVAAPAPATGTRILVNLSELSQLERVTALDDVDGVGLLRAELMLLEALGGDHPRTLLDEGRADRFVERMGEAIGRFADTFAPRPVTYRTIDFRTNEFRGLRGGERFEPVEANPMIGVRGVQRYVRDPEVFGLELQALRLVLEAGRQNLHVMLPFVRTARELERCVELIDEAGLRRRKGFQLWVMAEVPSVLFNLERYALLGVAGISIGSNDLTQLVLGVDRDSAALADVFDERDPAVMAFIEQLIISARACGLATSICGQAPSVHPEYADLLVRAGIDAISVTPDAVGRARRLVAAAEQRVLLGAARGSGPARHP